jgi:hypothetical protein
LSSLRIKLGSIKILVKAKDNERERFACLRQKLSQISEANTKEGIFVGPKITHLFEEQDFSTKLDST